MRLRLMVLLIAALCLLASFFLPVVSLGQLGPPNVSRQFYRPSSESFSCRLIGVGEMNYGGTYYFSLPTARPLRCLECFDLPACV